MQDAQITQDMELRRTVDDDERLAVLAEYGIDEAPWEPEYTRLARLLRQHCNMNWVALTLVGRDRQFFKVRDGFDLQHTPRHVSFCSVAMHLNQPLILEDARRDPRFANNPLVTGDPFIRFYAGLPIASSEGYPLGALCVIDMQPRTLFPSQVDLLSRARDWVKASLELRRLLRTRGQAGNASQPQSITDQKLINFARVRAERAWSRIVDPAKCPLLPPHPRSQFSDPSRLNYAHGCMAAGCAR